MADFAELGAEGVNAFTESKHFDKVWDKASAAIGKQKDKGQDAGERAFLLI